MITQRPIAWTANPDPSSIIGDFNDPSTHPGQLWSPNITLQIDGRIDAYTPGGGRAGVSMETCSKNDDAQGWTVSEVSGSPGYFELRGQDGSSSRTGHGTVADGPICLAVNGTYQPIAGASMVVHQPCAWGPASSRQWTLDKSSGHISNSQGLCVDIAAASKSPGAAVVAWPCKSPPDDDNEKWGLPSVGPSGPEVHLLSSFNGLCAER